MKSLLLLYEFHSTKYLQQEINNESIETKMKSI
jgi:hypothetical protein